MKWDNALPPLASRAFREKQHIPQDSPDLWWLGFRTRRAKNAGVQIRALVKAAARGYRSTGMPVLEFAPGADE